MRKIFILVLVAFLPILAIAQSKPDTLFFLNGEMAIAAVSKTTTEEVEYQYPNESFVNVVKIKDLAEVHLGSGRIVHYNKIVPNNYPESYTLTIGDQSIQMVFVEGGTFDMGFDGHHSLKMESEPIHSVTVTPFYISYSCVSQKTLSALMSYKEEKNDSMAFVFWEAADNATKKVADITGLNYRLPTEAEWECAATITRFRDNISFDQSVNEWCKDFFASFDNRSVTDPEGPVKGRVHVIRHFEVDNGIFDRSIPKLLSIPKITFRLAIKAVDAFPDL